MGMNDETKNHSDISRIAAQRYDKALRGAHRNRLLPGTPEPQPTAVWPKENVLLLGRYWVWLEEENSTPECIENIYLPMAGHVLGLNLKPHSQLDISPKTVLSLSKGSTQALDADLERAMDYIKAKQLSAAWTDICLRALHRFRRFLRYERGVLEVAFDDVPASLERYHEGLPDWLVEQLTQYQRIRQVNWRPSRLQDAAVRFWSGHSRLWQWLFAQEDENIVAVTDVKRKHLHAYIDERLAAGYAAVSVNQDLRAFVATLRFLQEREFPVPLTLLRPPLLKEPDALPRFLTDEEVGRLQTDLEGRVTGAQKPAQLRDAMLDRAAFYLLWHGGLRLGEVEDLCLSDLNLSRRQLVVRQGKGMKDRTVYLTEIAVKALVAYLDVRGQGHTDHLFLYRHRRLCRGLVHNRIKAAGKRAGVKVSCHRLRHTCATQLVNAGCRITTIQALLGHRRLNATMRYARVHDRTVAEDYYAAMVVIERRLEPYLGEMPKKETPLSAPDQSISGNGNGRLLKLVDALETEMLDEKQRTLVVELRCGILALA